MATKEVDLKAELVRLELSNEALSNKIDFIKEEFNERINDLDTKYQRAKPVLIKAAHSNTERAFAIVITILNLLLLLFR